MPQWHKQHVLITTEQHEWLRAESYTTGKSIGEIVRELIDAAISRRREHGKSISCGAQ